MPPTKKPLLPSSSQTIAYKRYLIKTGMYGISIEKDGFTISRSEKSIEAAKKTIDMLTEDVPDVVKPGKFTMTEGIGPVVDLGRPTNGLTRMQVQEYYERQRNLGLNIMDAVRGTEFALNLKNIQVDATGRTVVTFEQ